MEIVNVFYYLAVILLFAKSFGLLARKIGLPQVAGMVVAGVTIGLLGKLHDPDNFFLNLFMRPSPEEGEILHVFGQIGVVLILFSCGLETNLSDLKKSGGPAALIALVGVAVPMLLGTLGTLAFMRGYSEFDQGKLLNAVFVGTILAATSVGITAETLKEIGKLNTKVGQAIISAAIIDDVIGIIALSVVTSLKGGGAAQVGMTLLKAVGFFAFAIGVGILFRLYFKWEEKKFPHKRRTSIFAFAMCFLFAFVAEKYFGVASITGAYMAGIMLSGLTDTSFVDRKVVVSGYMIFSPIFFCYIGISAKFDGLSLSYLLFALAFVALGIAGKILGCGLAAKPFGFDVKQSTTIGCGMIARGEVALAVYSAGRSLIMPEGGIDPLVATILLIITSSVLCPVLLKALFKDKPGDGQLPLSDSASAEGVQANH